MHRDSARERRGRGGDLPFEYTKLVRGDDVNSIVIFYCHTHYFIGERARRERKFGSPALVEVFFIVPYWYYVYAIICAATERSIAHTRIFVQKRRYKRKLCDN